MFSPRFRDAQPAAPIREAFLQRLHTFGVMDWSGKPVSPPECARWGWKNKGDGILQCCGCGEFLSVEISSPSKCRKCECSRKLFFFLKLILISVYVYFCSQGVLYQTQGTACVFPHQILPIHSQPNPRAVD